MEDTVSTRTLRAPSLMTDKVILAGRNLSNFSNLCICNIYITPLPYELF
jgi:hypothetical protein